MKLVIDISEEDFNFIKGLRLALGGRGYSKELQRDVINSIRNGTPLTEEPDKEMTERPTGISVIKCKDCKHQIKEWREDRRMKEKGYWSYGCEYFGDLMGYWGFGGNDNEFCSEAEQRDEQEAEND